MISIIDLTCWNIREGYYKIDENGNIFSLYANKLMSYKTDKDGYKSIGLRCNNGKKRFFRVHRLVAKTFINNNGNDDLYVNHINGIKDDNRVENLEWCSSSYNQLHSIYVLGNIPTVTNEKKVIVTNILTKESVEYDSESDCARKLKCTQTAISSKLLGINSNPSTKGRFKNLYFEFKE